MGGGGNGEVVGMSIYVVNDLVIDFYMFIVLVWVVDGVGFYVVVGEILVIVGELGLGKMVMMLGLFGFLFEGVVVELCGEVEVDGKDIV